MSVQWGELIAAALFAACAWHCWVYEGRSEAQQWFGAGYLVSLIRESIFAGLSFFDFVNIEYAPGLARFASAPVAFALYFPALTYLAYACAVELVRPRGREWPGRRYGSRGANAPEFRPLSWRPLAWRVAALAAAVSLPLEFTATSLGWWTYPLDDPYHLAANLPYFTPFSWGLNGLLFFSVVWRVRRLRLRGSGHLWALITASPILGIAAALLTLVVEVVVALFLKSPLAFLVPAAALALLAAVPLLELSRPKLRPG